MKAEWKCTAGEAGCILEVTEHQEGSLLEMVEKFHFDHFLSQNAASTELKLLTNLRCNLHKDQKAGYLDHAP